MVISISSARPLWSVYSSATDPWLTLTEMDDHQARQTDINSNSPLPPSPSWFIYRRSVSLSSQSAKQDSKDDTSYPVVRGDSPSQFFWEAKSTSSSVAVLQAQEDQIMSSPTFSLVSSSHDAHMSIDSRLRSSSHDTQMTLGPSVHMRRESPRTPQDSPASTIKTGRESLDFLTNPVFRQAPSESDASPGSWDNSSPWVYASWSPVNEQTKILNSYRGPYETTHRFWLASDASLWTWTDYNSSTGSGGTSTTAQPGRFDPGPDFHMPVPQRQPSEQDINHPNDAISVLGPWTQKYLPIFPGQPIDIPTFLKTNCLEATREYLFAQRQQWLRLFRPNHHDWEEASHNPTSPSPWPIRYTIGGRTITSRQKAGVYAPYLYFRKANDSFFNPPPEPPVATDSLKDNVAGIVELMWKRMVHRSPVIEQEVIGAVHMLLVGACRVKFTHPHVEQRLADGRSDFGDGGIMKEVVMRQLEAAAQICQVLGATERAMRIVELAGSLGLYNVDARADLELFLMDGERDIRRICARAVVVLKRMVWEGRLVCLGG